MVITSIFGVPFLPLCDLFHTVAIQVADHFGFTYNQGEEDGMRKYLAGVKTEWSASETQVDTRVS